MTRNQPTLATLADGARRLLAARYRSTEPKGLRCCDRCVHMLSLPRPPGPAHQTLRRCALFGVTVHSTGTCARFQPGGV